MESFTVYGITTNHRRIKMAKTPYQMILKFSGICPACKSRVHGEVIFKNCKFKTERDPSNDDKTKIGFTAKLTYDKEIHYESKCPNCGWGEVRILTKEAQEQLMEYKDESASKDANDT